jgi:hypothetical protein
MLRRLASVKNPSSILRISSKYVCFFSTATENPWKEQKDPKGSNMTYFWNTSTNEVTPLGSPKPGHWVSVDDKATGGKYWWNPDTNETTVVNAPKPPHMVAVRSDTSMPAVSSMHTSITDPRQSYAVAPQKMVPPFPPPSAHHYPQPTFKQTIISYTMWGFGLTTAMIAVRAVLGF